MLATLSLLSFLGVAEFFGLGDEAKDVFYCTDSAFFVVREENAAAKNYGGDSWFTLQGTAQTPQRGYAYRFQFLSPDYAVISAGQPVAAAGGYGRGLPALGTLQVKEKFRLPDDTAILRLRLEGLTPQPRTIICNLSREQGQ